MPGRPPALLLDIAQQWGSNDAPVAMNSSGGLVTPAQAAGYLQNLAICLACLPWRQIGPPCGSQSLEPKAVCCWARLGCGDRGSAEAG